MNNNKVCVKIGRKYKDAFDGICKLVEHGCIDRSIVLECEAEKYIETEQYVFQYAANITSIDTGTQVGITPSGASWFTGLRGGKIDDVMGTWHSLIELIARTYHREYSLVEYIQPTTFRNEEAIKKSCDLIRSVADGLRLPVSRVVPAPQDESIEDVFSVSLRLEVFSGVGEPKPLLCKVYFRRTGGKYQTISSSEAALIDEFTKEIVTRGESADGNDSPKNNETDIVDGVLNSISKLIAGDLEKDFSKCILVTNEKDTGTLEEFADSSSQDEVVLECKRMKVLGISHIQWVDSVFYVYVEDRRAFRVKIGPNDAITMFCECNEENNCLIENNIIRCKSPKNGITSEIEINPHRADLGLNSSTLDMIQRDSGFAEHCFPISCSELLRRSINCTRYRCKCNSVKFTIDGKPRYKCADCPYPEVVFRHPDGTLSYTPSLRFNTATLSATEEPADTCRVCGRSYLTSELDSDFLCPFCSFAYSAVEEDLVTDEHFKTYKRYANMIPLSKRIGKSKKKKLCFENDDRLIFIIGKTKYFFDKLNITENGMISKPEKRQ